MDLYILFIYHYCNLCFVLLNSDVLELSALGCAYAAAAGTSYI
jgi:hypothetical protein